MATHGRARYESLADPHASVPLILDHTSVEIWLESFGRDCQTKKGERSTRNKRGCRESHDGGREYGDREP